MRKLTFEEITSRRISPEDINSVERFPIYGFLDNIRSLYNVGSIFRTADGVRLNKLYLTGITGYPPRSEIEKTALGAIEIVPWEYSDKPITVIKNLKKEGVKIVVLEQTFQSIPFQSVNYEYPTCLVVGNEVFGVHQDIIDLADTAVEIPMYGCKQSLNVTIAFGIVIYEMLSQYLSQTLTSHGSGL
jgi:tRNA G18 (ribose-2'-O)-methylase SpoU